MMDAFAGWALVIAIFGGFALVASCVNSLITGWWELRRRFPDPHRSLPVAHTSTMLRIGPDLQHGVGRVEIGVDGAGLHIRRGPLSCLWYRSLLFPWETVDARGTTRTWFVGTWDTYGVGYYTTVGLRSDSAAAGLVRGFTRPAGEVLHP